MSDNNKTPISNLVKEERVRSTKNANILAGDLSERPTEQVIVSMTSSGNWRYAVMTNYLVMYVLMFTTILGDTLGWWHVEIDPVLLATFVGATLGSTIPMYLQFRIGKKLN